MAAVDVTPVAAPTPHVSGAQRFFARAAYVFFAKPALFLLPVLIITAFGIYTATSEPAQYRSIGSLSVSNSSVLADQAQSPRAGNNFSSPAQTSAAEFNELMQTDEFVNQVIEGANLEFAVQLGLISTNGVRQNLYAIAAGDQLMRIIAVAEQAEAAKALAESAINTYKSRVISDEVAGSGVAETFWDQQLNTYKQQLDAANTELQSYLDNNQAPTLGERSDDQQNHIESLKGEVTRAQNRFDTALNNREQARLASVVSSADIDQRLRVLDEPTVPSLPESGLRAMLTTVIIFGALGVMMSLVAIAIATLLDRSILSAADLERFGVPTRAVVPRSKRMNIESSRRLAVVKSEPDATSLASAT